MSEATQTAPTEAQIRSKLRRRKHPVTAAELGTTAAFLRSLDGVVVVGKKTTGQRGRPALLFSLTEYDANATQPPH